MLSESHFNHLKNIKERNKRLKKGKSKFPPLWRGNSSSESIGNHQDDSYNMRDSDKEKNDESISGLSKTTSYATDYDSVNLCSNQTDNPRKAADNQSDLIDQKSIGGSIYSRSNDNTPFKKVKEEVPQFQSSRIKDAQSQIKDATSRNRDPIDVYSEEEKESDSEDDRSVDQHDSKAIKAISSFGLVEIKRETNDNGIRGNNTDKSMRFNAKQFASSSLGRKATPKKSDSVDSSNSASRTNCQGNSKGKKRKNC
jgi:hypothetical protein